MSPEGRKKLKGLLFLHESFRQFPYDDLTGKSCASKGCITIGIGRNLTDRGVSHPEALALLEDDITYFLDRLHQPSSVYGYFPFLDENRQIALVDMCFNIGINSFLNFSQMHECLYKRDYIGASEAMLDSLWANEVKDRAIQLARIVRTGEIE